MHKTISTAQPLSPFFRTLKEILEQFDVNKLKFVENRADFFISIPIKPPQISQSKLELTRNKVIIRMWVRKNPLHFSIPYPNELPANEQDGVVNFLKIINS